MTNDESESPVHHTSSLAILAAENSKALSCLRGDAYFDEFIRPYISTCSALNDALELRSAHDVNHLPVDIPGLCDLGEMALQELESLGEWMPEERLLRASCTKELYKNSHEFELVADCEPIVSQREHTSEEDKLLIEKAVTVDGFCSELPETYEMLKAVLQRQGNKNFSILGSISRRWEKCFVSTQNFGAFSPLCQRILKFNQRARDLEMYSESIERNKRLLYEELYSTFEGKPQQHTDTNEPELEGYCFNLRDLRKKKKEGPTVEWAVNTSVELSRAILPLSQALDAARIPIASLKLLPTTGSTARIHIASICHDAKAALQTIATAFTPDHYQQLASYISFYAMEGTNLFINVFSAICSKKDSTLLNNQQTKDLLDSFEWNCLALQFDKDELGFIIPFVCHDPELGGELKSAEDQLRIFKQYCNAFSRIEGHLQTLKRLVADVVIQRDALVELFREPSSHQSSIITKNSYAHENSDTNISKDPAISLEETSRMKHLRTSGSSPGANPSTRSVSAICRATKETKLLLKVASRIQFKIYKISNV